MHDVIIGEHSTAQHTRGRNRQPTCDDMSRGPLIGHGSEPGPGQYSTVQYSTVQYSGQDRSEVQSWNSSPSDFRLNFRIWRVLWSELMVYYWWCNISSPGLSSDIKSFMGTQSNCLDWNYRSLSLSWILIIIFIGWRKLNIYYFSTSFIPRFSFNSIVNMRTVILPRIWKCISKYLHEIILISIII